MFYVRNISTATVWSALHDLRERQRVADGFERKPRPRRDLLRGRRASELGLERARCDEHLLQSLDALCPARTLDVAPRALERRDERVDLVRRHSQRSQRLSDLVERDAPRVLARSKEARE